MPITLVLTRSCIESEVKFAVFCPNDFKKGLMLRNKKNKNIVTLPVLEGKKYGKNK